MTPANESSLIPVGRITAAHGIRGEVVLHSDMENPSDIAGYGPVLLEDGRSLDILSVRPAAKGLVARLKGITDRNAAETLRGQTLFLPRPALPDLDGEDDFYHADLIGLSACYINEDTPFGTIIAVHNFGADDILEIAPANGEPSMLVPFTRDAVPVVDLKSKIARIVTFENHAEQNHHPAIQ